MFDTIEQTRNADDGATDPNLQLMTQQQAATPEGSVPPPPPPLPSDPAPTAPAPSAPSTSLAPTSASTAVAPTAPPSPPAPTDAPITGTQSTTYYGANAGAQTWGGTYDPNQDKNGGYMVDGSSYNDYTAAKGAYEQKQLQAAGATNIQYNPFTQQYVDADKVKIYNDQGSGPADMALTPEQTQANQDRIAKILADPNTAPAIRELVQMPGYGTREFDARINDGSDPAFAAQIQALLGTARSQAPKPSTAPIGEDYLVNGQHYSTMADALKAQLSGGAGGTGGTPSRSLVPGSSTAGTPSSGLGTRMPVGSSGTSSGTAGGSGGVSIGQQILPGASGRLSNLQSMLDSSTNNLAMVDRFKLAQERFDQSAAASDPAYQLSIRRATQAAAGAGRIGSGMLRTSYGDLASGRQGELDRLRTGFLNDALEGTIGDQFKKTDALSGLERQMFGEEADTRGELRGERGYQGSLEQQAFERALQQWQQEQYAKQQQFENGVTLNQIGNQGNPADYYTQMAKEYGIDPSVLMALAQSMGSGGSRTTSGTSSSIPSIPAGYVDDTRTPGTALG